MVMRLSESLLTGFTTQIPTYHNVITIGNNVITFSCIVGDFLVLVNTYKHGILILSVRIHSYTCLKRAYKKLNLDLSNDLSKIGGQGGYEDD